MILYYAVGGGLGHVTRARRVLEAWGRADDAVIVTASERALDVRITGGIPVIEIPRALEHQPAAHRAWLREQVAALRPERLVADTFPGGIQGELCDLEVPMDLVARMLRWDEYRRVVSCDHAGPFDTTWLVEELSVDHDAYVRVRSGRVVTLDLAPSSLGQTSDGGSDPFWLIVHSGPEVEVCELIAYAAELRAMAEHPPARILVASPCIVPLGDGFEHADAVPASTLFPAAARIFSGAGFNVMLETEPWKEKHEVMPFARRFDDQYRRAARRRQRLGQVDAAEGGPVR